MSKRVYELAKELGVEAKQVLQRLRDAGVIVRDHLSPLTKEEEDKARKLYETPRPGDVQVKKIEGGRVVRRRVAGAAQPEPAAAPVVAQPVQAQAEVVSMKVAETAETPAMAEQGPVEPPTSVQPVAAEVAMAEPVAEPSRTPQAVEAPATVQPALSQQPTPASLETKPRVEDRPAATVPSKEQARPGEALRDPAALKAMAEKPDRKVKSQRLVYDRRRDVISIRDFMTIDSSSDEAEPTEVRTRSRRKKTIQRGRKVLKTVLTTPKEQKRVIKIEADSIQVSELARHMGVKAADVVKKLMAMGVMAGVTQALDLDTAGVIASEFGYTVERVGFDPSEILKEVPDGELELKPRPPVVTIMGHVDHGKTTLLDRIRKSHVAESEAGGITQHIGAYKVRLPTGDIVFLDTPGHEAFTAMRARGAKVTDIVILVVAADDGVMAQTVEAIAHAKDAGVPIVVAVNKIDKPEARPDRVKNELSEHGLISEEWGGQTIFCEVSAKQGKGIDNLLEMVLLQAQMLELKANPDKAGRGVVIEAQLDRQIGPTATVLNQSGTVKVGDVVIAGLSHGRIRTMVDDLGKPVGRAGPATPVRMSGMDLVPNAGDAFVVVADEEKARKVSAWQMEQAKAARAARAGARVTLEDFHRMVEAGSAKELRIILRTDVQGSLGALTDAIVKLKAQEVTVKLIHSAVGNITESDVNLAIASNAVIVGFSVTVDPKAASLADQEKVDIRRYSIIYDMINDITKAMEGMLEPKLVKKLTGKAEVRQVFAISKVGKIAGVFVSTGHVIRTSEVHVVRGKDTVFEGRLSSLKRFKEDQREVKQGFECGVGVEGFEDIEVGDWLEFYETEVVKPGE